MEEETNITKLPVRAKPDPNEKPPVKLARGVKCRHRNVIVDETKSEVECEDCGEKLNPVFILARFAREDDNLYWRRESLRKEVKSCEDRLKFKCGSCGQVNNITKPLRTRTILPENSK